jgi:hypothetical protein
MFIFLSRLLWNFVGAKLKFPLYHQVERLMLNGMVTMNQKEIKYLEIIQCVVSGKLTQVAAAKQLNQPLGKLGTSSVVIIVLSEYGFFC